MVYKKPDLAKSHALANDGLSWRNLLLRSLILLCTLLRAFLSKPNLFSNLLNFLLLPLGDDIGEVFGLVFCNAA